MAVAKAKNQSAAMILLARRSPDMVYEYSGWQIARYLNRKGFRVPFDIHCFNKLDTLAISLSVMP